MANVIWQLPPPPHTPRQSRFASSANKWGPAGVCMVLGAIAPIVYAMQLSAEAKARIETLDKQQEKTGTELAELRTKLNAFRTNQARWRLFADGAFCRLDVKVPHGCPAIQYHPEPMRGSKAPRIQPSVATEPLLETDEPYDPELD